MPKISKKFVSIAIILACFGVVFGAKFSMGLLKKNAPTDIFAKVKGMDSAPIKITEFIDFQCPACAHGAKYLKEMMVKHPEAIRLELKHYPLKMHQYGLLSAQYAECAAQQGNFWSFHDSLLARQNNWKRLADARPAFMQIAEDVALDMQALELCVEGDAAVKIIEGNKAEGKSLGIKSTPTYFVSGKMVVGEKSLNLELLRLLEKHGH